MLIKSLAGAALAALILFTASDATDARGHRGHREHRSAKAKHEFKMETGFPHGRPGYVIDHITPLACGGADAPSNMQWQTTAAGKAKDKTERRNCAR